MARYWNQFCVIYRLLISPKYVVALLKFLNSDHCAKSVSWRTFNYLLGNFVSAGEVVLPGDIATKWCQQHLLFQYNFCWFMMMDILEDYSSHRPGKSSKTLSTTSQCLSIFRILHSTQRDLKIWFKDSSVHIKTNLLRRRLWCFNLLGVSSRVCLEILLICSV